MSKRFTLGLSILLTLAFSATALAAPSASPDQLLVRSSLSSLGFDMASDQIVTSKIGRKNLFVQTTQSTPAVVSRLKSAYRNGKTLSSGLKVTGYAHIVADDSYTFTFERKEGGRLVAQVKNAARGSQIKIWGVNYANNPRRVPVNAAPRRHARVPSHVMR